VITARNGALVLVRVEPYPNLLNKQRRAFRATHNNTMLICILALRPRWFYFHSRANTAHSLWEARMTWKAPKIVEVPVGMEINMYACAARK
jgi:coenzyme PQQ precursor peptide PqqA